MILAPQSMKIQAHNWYTYTDKRHAYKHTDMRTNPWYPMEISSLYKGKQSHIKDIHCNAELLWGVNACKGCLITSQIAFTHTVYLLVRSNWFTSHSLLCKLYNCSLCAPLYPVNTEQPSTHLPLALRWNLWQWTPTHNISVHGAYKWKTPKSIASCQPLCES